MAGFQELEKRYEKIPEELKTQKRWVCYKAVLREGKSAKMPIAVRIGYDGQLVPSSPDNPSDWGDFHESIRFCADNNLDGLGFQMGDKGMFGIDLTKDPATQEETTEEAYRNMCNDFYKELDSYSEWSISGNGMHIICYGDLPQTPSPSSNIKIYGPNMFFAMSGRIVGETPKTIRNRTKEIKDLLDKYERHAIVKKAEVESKEKKPSQDALNDGDVIRKATQNVKSGQRFQRLMAGDTTDYPSKEDAKDALCKFLAYYSKCNESQIDRIFRKSGLFDQEWDNIGENGKTNGYMCIQRAVEVCLSSGRGIPSVGKKRNFAAQMNLDETGEPIFRISDTYKKTVKKYTLDDTGNALRFYDCFGENFKWDTKNKEFMFWTGKTWISDTNNICRKYANQLIVLLRDESVQMGARISEETDENVRKTLVAARKTFDDNIRHLSSKGGKDAMLNELQSIGSMPVDNSCFNKNPLLLNTDSGIVNLETGEVKPFDKNEMLSVNTKVEVSFEEPTLFLKFLRDILAQGDEQTVEEIVECFQRCLGYTLTGLTTEQCMFLLQGDGSNGKSTLAVTIQGIMGDYFNAIDPQQLMIQKNGNSSVQIQNSFAEMVNTRFLLTSETDKGAKLSPSTIKRITGSTPINAQRKYGKPFWFTPVYKIWMETNNLPSIYDKDYGIWRRIFMFTFYRQFKESEKDKDLPDKLKQEYPKILGWCIKGAVKYLKEKDLKKPACLVRELEKFKASQDRTERFLISECRKADNSRELCSEVYKAYKQWALNNNEGAEAESKFREEMIKKGFTVWINDTNGSKFYEHIILNASSDRGSSGFAEKVTPW